VSTSFEQAFAEAERSAAAAVKAGGQIASAAKQMQKAAQEGDITKLRKTAERLALVSDGARQDVANARTAWPFSESEERDYLADGYEAELLEEALRSGLKIYARDARLLAYPSILQIMPGELSIKVDKKKLGALRPGHLVRVLLANQKKKARQPAERFVECLYATYRIVAPEGAASPVVKLSQIYQTLTLRPGAAAEYSRSDFALDLFSVDESGVSRTNSGARLSLPASTGTKGGGRDLFTFVAPDGDVRTYYGIRFTEG
jgi:hypothetical protein